MRYIQKRDWVWILPISLALGAGLSFIQPGDWLIGWLAFSILFMLSGMLLIASVRWAGAGKALMWMVILAFALRFGGGVSTYLLLPVLGHEDTDDQSGHIFTDAHRRDDQAWDLAASDRPILDAFNRRFAYDQYGGLLAFSAFIYRYLSPDAHRVLLLVLVSALMGVLGLPFLWKALHSQWDEKVALASGWIFALYPESVLLGGSAMREPYLHAFSAFALWGFIDWHLNHNKKSFLWLGLGIAGMLLVSPSIALVTLIILGGWLYFSSERRKIPWWAVVAALLIFVAGLFLLSSALDRQGNLGGGTPLGVINNFVRESLRWNVYKIEEESGWVQKLFDENPRWIRLPFVLVYGILQPVLPATLIAPTTVIWKVIFILRSLGWYALLPALILSFVAGASTSADAKRKILLWLSFVAWGWVLFTALRGGGDQWDNPRYRVILLVWQAIVAGHVWVWWRETRNAWVGRVLTMELVFLAVFTQWYLNRYLQIGFQLPFVGMIALILGIWLLLLVWGLWRDRWVGVGHGV
ncbi:MAG: glycosyltransferase family 39 protein [Anaerolineae bacterium]|nr:glycosyltransferase family 39 protein [Anaerolineae bacterium]